MKWLKFLIELAKDLIPIWAKIRKDKLSDELEVVRGVHDILTANMTPAEKGRIIQEAVGNLKAVKKFKKRISNKLDKARDRLAEKFL